MPNTKAKSVFTESLLNFVEFSTRLPSKFSQKIYISVIAQVYLLRAMVWEMWCEWHGHFGHQTYEGTRGDLTKSLWGAGAEYVHGREEPK